MANSSMAGYDCLINTGIIICITAFVFYFWCNIAASKESEGEQEIEEKKGNNERIKKWKKRKGEEGKSKRSNICIEREKENNQRKIQKKRVLM